MIEAKQKKDFRKTTNKLNTESSVSLSSKGGVVYLESDLPLLALHIWHSGKAEIESLLDESWLVVHKRNQIIIVNISGNTFQNVDLFKYTGTYKLIKFKSVDENKKFVKNWAVPDGRNYKWRRMSKSNRWDTNTTEWTDIKSDELVTKVKQKTTGKKNDSTGVGDREQDPFGAGGGKGY